MDQITRIEAAPGQPTPLGPYVQVVTAADLVFTAGQVPLDVDGQQPEDFRDQVRQAIANLRAGLEAAGSDLEHVVKVNTYLTDPDQLTDYNEVYAEFFAGSLPARTSICTTLWGVSLEIECIAIRHGEHPRRSVRGDDLPGALGIVGMTPAIADQLGAVEFPTLGHFLDEGFCGPQIRLVAGGPRTRVVGRAAPLVVHDADSVVVNRALDAARPGDVLVIDMAGDQRHACVGAVTATAARARGLVGIVVDGVVTDRADLERVGVPVWARGTTCLTTKPRENHAAHLGSATIDGVTVSEDHLVLADENGVLFATLDELAGVLDQAIASDEAEPSLRAALTAGEPIGDLLRMR